jgi:hypothetical protein
MVIMDLIFIWWFIFTIVIICDNTPIENFKNFFLTISAMLLCVDGLMLLARYTHLEKLLHIGG